MQQGLAPIWIVIIALLIGGLGFGLGWGLGSGGVAGCSADCFNRLQGEITACRGDSLCELDAHRIYMTCTQGCFT